MMRENGSILTTSVLLLVTFNYTLPFQKETLKPETASYRNGKIVKE